MKSLLLIPTLFLCFAASAAYGQKLQVLIDNDASQTSPTFDVVIRSNDDAIVSILVSTEDLPPTDWTTHKITPKGLFNHPLKKFPNKKITYTITAFNTDGKVVDSKRVEVQTAGTPKLPTAKPGKQNNGAESEKGGDESAESEQNDIVKCSEIVSALIRLVEVGESSGTRLFAAREIGKFGKNATCGLGKLTKQLGQSTDQNYTPEVKKELEASLTKIVRGASRQESEVGSVSGSVKDEYGDPVDGVLVQALNASGKVLRETYSNEKGQYEFDSLPTGAVRVKSSVQGRNDGFQDSIAVPIDSGPAPKERDLLLKPRSQNNFESSVSGQFSRIILGFEQAGATASESRRNFFFDGFFSTPLPWKAGFIADNKDGFPYLSFWGNPRIASAPDPAIDELEIQDFVRDFSGRAASTRVKNLVQTFELTAGLELTLTHPRKQLRGLERGVRNRFSFGLIAGAGIVAPINPRESIGTNIFEVTPEAEARYPQAAGKKYIAFVAPERDRFYRQYFAGVRLKTFYHTNGGRLENRYPATVDITFGQNEAITGGFLRGGVMKIEGFVPFPIKDFGSIFIFGTAQMKFSRPNFSDPLILRRADASISLPDPNAAIVTILPQNRDYYRIGIGVDPVRLFKDFRRLGQSDSKTLKPLEEQ